MRSLAPCPSRTRCNRTLRLVPLALLLAGGACEPQKKGPQINGEWEDVGNGLARLVDRQTGVVCYKKTTTSYTLSCLRMEVPPVTPEANDAQK